MACTYSRPQSFGFLFLVHLKLLVCGVDIPHQETLHRRAMEACETIPHHPGEFEMVRQSSFDESRSKRKKFRAFAMSFLC